MTGSGSNIRYLSLTLAGRRGTTAHRLVGANAEDEILNVAIERDSLGFDAPAALGHPARASMPEDASTGPEIGERLPDFELPDASGRPVRFHEQRGGRKAALVFYRSAVW